MQGKKFALIVDESTDVACQKLLCGLHRTVLAEGQMEAPWGDQRRPQMAQHPGPTREEEVGRPSPDAMCSLKQMILSSIKLASASRLHTCHDPSHKYG